MALNYVDLDDTTRRLMIEEIVRDESENSLYLSKRFTDAGALKWPALIKEAARYRDDDWIVSEIRENRYMRDFEVTARGPRKVPVNAPEVLAEGEFNRFYCRALCLRAIEEGLTEVVVYRAKEVERPRPESIPMIGRELDPSAVLEDLRTHTGVDTALGIPPGPGSGLSLKLRP